MFSTFSSLASTIRSVKSSGPLTYMFTSGGAFKQQTTAIGHGGNSGNAMCTNHTGQYILHICKTGTVGIYLSSNYGVSTALISSASLITTHNYSSVCMSSSGQYMYIVSVATGSLFYKSSDFGATWSSMKPNGTVGYVSVSCTNDGSIIYVGSNATNVLMRSLDFGTTWSNIYANVVTTGCTILTVVVSKFDGNYVSLINNNTAYVYTSNNAGASFTHRPALNSIGLQKFIAMSGNGECQCLTQRNNGATTYSMYTSLDYGVTWNYIPASNNTQKHYVSMSEDGNTIVSGFWGSNNATSNIQYTRTHKTTNTWAFFTQPFGNLGGICLSGDGKKCYLGSDIAPLGLYLTQDS